MVIGIIGENCSGKSTLSNEIKKEFDAEEKKHGMFDGGIYDYRIDGVNGDPEALCAELRARCSALCSKGGKQADSDDFEDDIHDPCLRFQR